MNKVIPGGAHTYSRGDDQFPVNAPAILQRGEGAYVWAPDGRKFLDYGMALRAVTLGYAHPEVTKSVCEEVYKGNRQEKVVEIFKVIEISPVVKVLKVSEICISERWIDATRRSRRLRPTDLFQHFIDRNGFRRID
ncbi:MAG: aminotransferase class III-fold pyridoxal phosphate-dependent enzyme [Proteobacteria bacterium]|nr:MAG: aminotransferase class III-fold pyridoxal phosphate-dependent enzyme [Pseudomonadota bacterium]